MAIPNEEDGNIAFAITNSKGVYDIQLKANTTYKITITYLGYQGQELEITTEQKDVTYDFVLKAATETLDEVVLNYKVPIIVKEDTLIYNTDSFTNGKERKLRDILKKLPGAEVDRNGNVTVNGKKVTKVMVEGKTFFTGDSKLAVNNIPADAVDQIEVLDNYSEVAFLKGLADSDKMAMNIKLKEGKKKFVFGDVEVGGGNDKYYLLHPALFYYAPKTNVSFIADINNMGTKSFSMQDYMNFNGGIQGLLNDMSGYFDLYNDDFSKYLNNTEFTANTNRFGAVNFRQTLSKHLDVNSYVIASNNDTETAVSQLRTYLADEPYDEYRTTGNTMASAFLLGKVNLTYRPGVGEDFSWDSTVKLSSNQAVGSINSESLNETISVATIADVDSYEIKQQLAYSKELSKAHTGTVEGSFETSKKTPDTYWGTNEQLLQGLIPLEVSDYYNIYQHKKQEHVNVSAIAKEYWVVNNYNHIYTTVGFNMNFDALISNEYQELEDGTQNNFSSAGFGNDFSYDLTDVYAGMEYKFLTGKFTVKPALFYHGYHWQTIQSTTRNSNFKSFVLPKFTVNYKISGNESLYFRYTKNVQFPSVGQLANNYMLSNFNSIYRGNNALSNSLYHTTSLNYHKTNMYKGFMLMASVLYNKRVKSVKNTTVLQGIAYYNTPVRFGLAENNVNTSVQLRKKINTLRYNVSTGFSYTDFYQLVNEETTKNTSKSITVSPGITTLFNKHWPELEVSYRQQFTFYKTWATTTNFNRSALNANMEYRFFKDFLFQGEYNYTLYQNKDAGTRNRFNTANASLLYQQEDSPWAFEVMVTNVFDVRYQQDNSFSDYLISDTKTYIMPRVLLFKVTYKL